MSITDRIGRTRRYHYGPRGWLTRLENGNGGDYQFSHDAVGRLTGERRPDNSDHFYLYDADGRLSEHRETGPQGAPPCHRRHRFRFDAAGQLAWRGSDDAQWEYRYDPAGRMTAATRTPTAAGAALGIEEDTVELAYDKAGNLLRERGVNGEVGYAWDALANLQSLTLPQGDRLTWLYYGSGHASAMKFNDQLVSEFTRDRLHREIGRSQGALYQRRGYDALGRRSWQSSGFAQGIVTRPEEGVLWRTFRYTGRGELESVHDALRGDVHYGFDPEGRLLQHLEPQQNPLARRLQYDLADNLVDAPPVPVVSNRLAHWQRLFYRYDAWGNLVSRRSALNEQHYVYDADNRLLRASGRGPQGDFSAQYHYDALGRRTRKTVTYKGKRPQTTRFLWQGYRLLQEQRDNGTRRSWSYDPASPWTPLAAIEQADGGPQADIYWLHADLNSAPLEVTDADGKLRWSGQYDTFGRLKGQTTGSMALREGVPYDQPLRYAGQYEDAESGLHYNLFRYYDPEVGRFTVQDPIGLNGGLNVYQYAPNPAGWIDPWGLAGSPLTATHITYQGVDAATGKPYVGYASMQGHQVAQDVLNYRYGGNFDRFGGQAPQIIYEGYGQSGKDLARGLEQRRFEQLGGLEGTANRQNPVGQGNARRTEYLNAADEHLNGKKAGVKKGGRC